MKLHVMLQCTCISYITDEGTCTVIMVLHVHVHHYMYCYTLHVCIQWWWMVHTSSV